MNRRATGKLAESELFAGNCRKTPKVRVRKNSLREIVSRMIYRYRQRDLVLFSAEFIKGLSNNNMVGILLSPDRFAVS